MGLSSYGLFFEPLKTIVEVIQDLEKAGAKAVRLRNIGEKSFDNSLL